jgi:hypothetical protein
MSHGIVTRSRETKKMSIVIRFVESSVHSDSTLTPQTPPWTSVLTSLSTGIWSGALFFFLSSPQSIGMTAYYPSHLTKLKPSGRLTKLNPCVRVCVSLRQITSYKYKMMHIKGQIYQSGLPIDSRPLQPRCVTRVVMLSAARRQPRDRVLRSRGNPYESTS